MRIIMIVIVTATVRTETDTLATMATNTFGVLSVEVVVPALVEAEMVAPVGV